MIRKREFGILCLCCVLLCTSAKAKTLYVDGRTASRVHLRSAASQQSESMGLFYTGTEVELTGGAAFEDSWERVNIGAMTGYIMCDYLTEERPEAYMPVAYVESGTLNLRSEPSKQSQVLQVLEKDDRLVLMGQTADDWYYVICPDGTIGYVMPEYVSLSGESISLSNADICQVGETFDGYFIYSWNAPNGQTIYFTALEDPAIKFEDVNFDGHKDLVVFIIRGASNFFTEFYVWDDGQYVRARQDASAHGVCNYHLYPEYGIVHSDANNGLAGAEHEDVLLRWEGTDLRAIRRAVSEPLTETTWFADGGGYTQTYDTQNLRVRVWDYTSGVTEGEIIYDQIISIQQLNTADDYDQLFAGEQEALWLGIK